MGWGIFLSLLFSSMNAFAGAQSFLPFGFCPGIVEHTYYNLCYEPEHRHASWVKHSLTLESINGKQKRTNDYRYDPKIEDPVLGSDYRGSGFDRGHLLPAADMKLNRQAMSETFFMTNMSPQNPSFNRGIWARIERRMRDLVRQHGDAHVITGPILEEGLPTIDAGVSIPHWYYKVAYFPEASMMKAFLIANERPPEGAHYSDYLVSVDEVEELSGFDFFEELPDYLESELESLRLQN